MIGYHTHWPYYYGNRYVRYEFIGAISLLEHLRYVRSDLVLVEISQL
jgi:hypothetical protein